MTEKNSEPQVSKSTPQDIRYDWFVYMIETDKGALYTGIATDVDRRFSEHLATYEKTPLSKAKRGAKFFRSQKPLRIVYQERQESRSEATKRELALKALNHADKKLLLDSPPYI